MTRLHLIAGLAVMAAALLSAAWDVRAEVPPDVPTEFQDLYPVMQSDLGAFQATIAASWSGAKTMQHFAAELLSANANQGAALLKPTALSSVNTELTALKNLGVDTVTICMHFPVFHDPFYTWLKTQPGFTGITYTAADFETFYQNVFALVRSKGMRVDVEAHVLFSSGTTNTWPMSAYYATLTFNQFVAARAAQLVTIASDVRFRPDYLSLQAEPDTEASQSGFAIIAGVNTSTAMVARFLTELYAANTTTPYGLGTTVLTAAGVGTWDLPAYNQLIVNEATLMPILDIIDMHIYPVNHTGTNDFLANARWIAAHANGKKLSMTEAWLSKERDGELGGLSPFDVFARNNYSFWIPLDQEFLQTLVKFGHWQNLEFTSFFWSFFFYGYADYAQAQQACPPGPNQDACLNAQANQAAVQNLIQGKYSPTGLAYRQFILGNFLPQITSPAACSPNPVTSAAAALSVAATDDGGAGNLSYRWTETANPGVASQIAAPAQAITGVTFFQPGNYRYAVAVSDAGGNTVNSYAAVVVTPNSAVIPKPPRNFRLK